MVAQVISVKTFITEVGALLSETFPMISVEGEVSEYKIWREDHVYFTLKEGEYTLDCYIWRANQKTPVEAGMKVVATGNPRLLTKGRFQFRAVRLVPSGEGELLKAYELFKAKLELEGAFEKKRVLPRFPERIGLVTAKGSDAHKDFVKHLNERWGGVECLLMDTKVEGAEAIEQVAFAIDTLNQQSPNLDLIVVTRGGGSLESLQAFNSEPVVRAIMASRTPTIVAIGHEANISLAELVADARASTPTGAANLAVPDRTEISAHLARQGSSLVRCMVQLIAHNRLHLQSLSAGLEAVFRKPLDYVNNLEERLTRYWLRYEGELKNQRQAVENLGLRISAAHPEKVLARGYSITYRGQKPVKDSAELKAGDALLIKLHKGRVDANVRKT